MKSKSIIIALLVISAVYIVIDSKNKTDALNYKNSFIEVDKKVDK